MRLSTRSRYGLRFMYELALHYGQGMMLLKHIAETQGISEKYLSNLAIPLKGAGLVNSVRGSHGGYELAKPPASITVKDIYMILEGDPVILDCIGNEAQCTMNTICPTRDMWLSLQERMENFLGAVTLKNLVDDFEIKRSREEFIYHI